MEETYQEVIDAYNLSSEKKQGMSLTDYIKRNNIKIKDIDTTPEKKAGGGMMRLNYAMGSEDEIPEVEEESLEEFRDLLKSLGAPTESKESGIRSLKNKMVSNDANERLLEQLYEQFLDEGMLPEEAAKAARKRFMDMSVKRKAPSIKMAEYNPGDYDPLIVDEYEKYKFDAEEQGQPVMDIDEFLKMERAGVMGGGIMRNMYAAGTPYEMMDGKKREINLPEKFYDNPFDAREAGDLEDRAMYRDMAKTDIPVKKTNNSIDLDVEAIKKLIEKKKKEKAKRAKGGIAGVL